MAFGYMGKILWIDLSQKKHWVEELNDDVYKQFLGGYGLGVKILYDRMKPRVDPLGPENILGFLPGLLTSTGTLFSGRYMVVGKSPLTGGWGDSNSGGYFTNAIKRAGYDGIFITGASEKPVYVYINNDTVEIRDASFLWGMDTIKTEEELKKVVGKGFQIATIGPAGEKLSLISGIGTDRGRFAARSGLGAVMGSKKLKAICVKGSVRVNVYDRKLVSKLTKDYMKRFEKKNLFEKGPLSLILRIAGRLTSFGKVQPKMMSDTWRGILRKYGTSGVTAMSAINGDSPVKNWKGVGLSDFPLVKARKISDESIIRHERKKYKCFSCPLGCGGIVSYKDPRYDIKESHKPEYETTASFGSLLLNDDLGTIMKLNDMCNRAGLDTISAGGVIAFAVECFENGIIDENDTDGLVLGWGKGETYVKLLEKIIKREGIGDILADGVKVASSKIGKGSQEFAVHAGGQEIAMHDPKFDPGYGVSYSVDPTPGRHTTAAYTWLELFDLEKKFKKLKAVPMILFSKEKYDFSKKKEAFGILVKYLQVSNSCGMCVFGMSAGADIPIFEWLNAVTGWNFSSDDYLKIGHRIQTLRFLFNLRENITYKDSLIHKRAKGDPPLKKGPLAGVNLDLDSMIKGYFEVLGFNPDTGIPTEETLKDLDLYDSAKEVL